MLASMPAVLPARIVGILERVWTTRGHGSPSLSLLMEPGLPAGPPRLGDPGVATVLTPWREGRVRQAAATLRAARPLSGPTTSSLLRSPSAAPGAAAAEGGRASRWAEEVAAVVLSLCALQGASVRRSARNGFAGSGGAPQRPQRGGQLAAVGAKQGAGRRASALIRPGQSGEAALLEWTPPTAAEAREKDREILSLAWPTVLSASIDPVLSLVDTYWVSVSLGTVSLAALGPALNIEDWLFEILKTIQVPVRSLTAQAIASKRRGAVAQVLEQSLCLALRVGVAAAVLGVVLAPWLLRLSSVGPGSPLLEPAKRYLVPRLLGTPGLLMVIVLQAALLGAFKDTRTILRLVLLGGVVNSVLTPWFIKGFGQGTGGAAWATTIACYASANAAWFAVKGRAQEGDRLLPSWGMLAKRVLLFRRSGEEEGGEASWLPLLQANAAMTVRTFASITTWLFACMRITPLGVAPLAAHTCMVKTFLLLLFSLYGFQLASQVLVSTEVQRGDTRYARWTALRVVRLGVIVAATVAGLLWFGQGAIMRALAVDPTVAVEFAKLVPPTALMLLIYGVTWSLDGVVYGLGDYVWAAKCSILAALSAVVSMLFFARSASGVWWSLNVMVVIRTVAVVHRVFFRSTSPLVVPRTNAASTM